MPTRLRKLRITRVAVCEQGANPDADILLFKSVAPVTKQPMHAEPDGDEATPLDYATRSRQQDLWRCVSDMWDRFCCTFYDIIGDCDEDNIPHLPILVASIGQFQEDVAELLTELGVMEKWAPALAQLQAVSKAGATMAGHRLARFKDALAALQALLEECMPPQVEHAGISAAETLGIPGAVNGQIPGQSFPVMAKKGQSMADAATVVAGNVAQQQLDTLQKQVETVTQEREALAKRVTTAEARVQELEPLVQQKAELETTIAKLRQTPEEQEAEYLASLPESVRKRYEADQLEKVELRKRLQEADERVERTEYIAKTAAFRSLGMVDEHWKVLKAFDAIPDEEVRTEAYRLLQAAAAQLEASPLFVPSGFEGRAVNGSNGSGTAESQLMALAQAHATEKGVMLDKAIEAVAKAHPELWERDQREKRASNRVQLGSR